MGPTSASSYRSSGRPSTDTSINPLGNGTRSEYFDRWEAEIAARSWSFVFGEDTNGLKPAEITVLDIKSSGDIDEWQLSTEEPVFQEWIRTSRERLRTLGQDCPMRVILFDESTHLSVQELIGLHYDIEPLFFVDVRDSVAEGREGYQAHGQGDGYLIPEFMVGLSPPHLNLGYGWTAKILRPAQVNTPGPDTVGEFFVVRSWNLRMTAAVIIASRVREIPLSAVNALAQTKSISYSSPGTNRLAPDKWHIDYQEVYLSAIRQCDSSFLVSAQKDPLMILVPILEIHVAWLHGFLSSTSSWLHVGRKSLDEYGYLVESSWDQLRMLKLEGARPFECFRQYVLDFADGFIQRNDKCANLFRRMTCVMAQIDRMEQLAKDYVQIRVGRLSLEESRASIKQSKIAIEEGRRTKLINILAFFFVPMSLGTSVFGMNISELNQTGQPLWVFIVTTAAIFLTSTLFWALSYQVHKYNSLPTSSVSEMHPSYLEQPEIYVGKPIRWQMRAHLFLRLLSHGHILWIWESGIIFSLLTNGRKGFISSCSKHVWPKNSPKPVDTEVRYRECLWHSQDYVHYPCAYIVVHLNCGYGFECSKLEDRN